MTFIKAHSGNYATPRGHAIDYLVIHYTGSGVGKDTARSNAIYYANNSIEQSAHYFVDENEIVQSVREGDRAFHAGDKPMNDRSIGIEMCSRLDAKGQWYIPNVTVSRTAELARELMQKYNIPLDHVIRHFDVNGKSCPEPFVRNPSEWLAFKALLREEVKPVDIGSPSPWAREACEWTVEKSIVKGDGKSFRWKDPVTREEMVVMLYRAMLNRAMN